MSPNRSLYRGAQLSVALVFILLIGASAAYWTWLDFRRTDADAVEVRERLIRTHKQRIKREVESALHFLRFTLGDTPSPPKAKLDEVSKYLASVRFGNDDRLFGINVSAGRVMLFGAYPHDFDLSSLRPKKLEHIEELVAKARSGGGFKTYLFNDALGATRRQKISYIAPLTPQGYCVGAGVYLPAIEAELAGLQAAAWSRTYWRLGGAAVTVVLGLLLGLLLSRRLASGLADRLRTSLAAVAEQLSEAAANNEQLDADAAPYAEFTPFIESGNAIVENRMRAQSQLLQAQKMEAVGQLAGGLAHDFNNLLTTISANAELLEMGLEGEDALAASDILLAAEQAAALTQNLLSFSRKGQLALTSVDVHAVVRDVVRLLERSIDRRIAVVVLTRAEFSIVKADRAQLQSALLNLGLNARDAMSCPTPCGVLEISTRNLELPAARLGSVNFLELTVSDTGSGMSEAIIERIFEPFFTTKGTGGTGLGLAGTRESVHGCGGTIEVESQLGEGTRFRILLPTAKMNSLAGLARPSDPVKGSGRVLVIDDELAVGTAARRALESLGYEVDVFCDPRKGLEAARTDPERYQLVLLDMMMPDLSGEQVLIELQRIDPALPVVVYSGFAKEDAARQMMAQGATGFVHKPFRLTQLSRRIASCLRGAPGRSAT